MSATRCPRCGGSGTIAVYNNTSSVANLSHSCNACAGIGVIYDPAPVFNITINVREGEDADAIAKRVRAEVRRGMRRQVSAVGMRP